MTHKRALREHPDDIGVELAPRVTPQQLADLFACGYRGPTPSTAPQADALLRQWRRSTPPVEEAQDVPRA